VDADESTLEAVDTFFFRNRPELELLARLLDQKSEGSSLGLNCESRYSIPSSWHCRRIDSLLRWRSSIPRRSGTLIFRTSALKNPAPRSVRRSWHAVNVV